MPEADEDETKSQSKRAPADMTRGSNILNKVVAVKDVSDKSSFTGNDVPVHGVFTDHEQELGKVQ